MSVFLFKSIIILLCCLLVCLLQLDLYFGKEMGIYRVISLGKEMELNSLNLFDIVDVTKDLYPIPELICLANHIDSRSQVYMFDIDCEDKEKMGWLAEEFVPN